MKIRFKNDDLAAQFIASMNKAEILFNVIGIDWWDVIPDGSGGFIANVAGLSFMIRAVDANLFFDVKGE